MSFILDDHLEWFGAEETLLDDKGKMQRPWVYYSKCSAQWHTFPESGR